MEFEIIKLQTKEGKDIPLKKSAAMLSNYLKRNIQEGKDQQGPISIAEVDDKIVEKILDYLINYNGVPPKEIEKPLQSDDMKKATDEFSSNFIDNLNLDELICLLKAASFLEINSLIDLCCAKCAAMCFEKSEEDIFKVFNITECLTEDEKNKIREEMRWIEGNLD